MKRKLDANDVPSPDAVEAPEQEASFESLDLDPRLRQALIQEKFTKPTPVQSKAIPLALEGKDILGEWPNSNYRGRIRNTDGPSSCKDRFWQDRRLCPPDPASHTTEEICSSRLVRAVEKLNSLTKIH